jgi:zinc finger SWIM domain-containing protein 3
MQIDSLEETSMATPSSIDPNTVLNPTPRLNMEFETLDDAWEFWKNYGGLMGFTVRKRYANKDKNEIITSGGFVCGNEGIRGQDNRVREVKRPRAETRTNCPARLRLKLIRQTRKYIVSDFIAKHNHDLQGVEAKHLIRSQRNVSQYQATTIDLADDAGIRPKEAYELMSREAGGVANVGHSRRDHYNYLRTKRRKSLAGGEAGSIMRYFYGKTLENTSFCHTEKVDDNGQITNIFWADAKMLVDYALFGDVITFDTTFSTNKEYRPFGVFVGFNHLREIVVFGASLLYDESVESFEWLFETFLEAQTNKQPKMIFTDQDPAMAKALKKVMPDTTHGLCTWHISQNAIKNLISKKKRNSSTKVRGNEILKMFKACMYDYQEVNEFEMTFTSMKNMISVENKVNEEIHLRDDEKSVAGDEHEESDISEKMNCNRKRKVGGESWLNFIYKVKEKWAQCYMKNEFTLGMRTTQLSESFNKDLKSFLKSSLDVVRFFHHFERVLIQKREKEIETLYEMRKKQPRLKANIPILQQMSLIYTPKVFEIFQEEWEISMASSVKSKIESQLNIEYCILVYSFDNGHCNKCFQVIFNHVDQSVSCNCNKFGKWGVLCGHALKVLDVMDIKLLPEKYIIRRWTREARSNVVQDVSGMTIIENPKLDANRRYHVLSRTLLKIAARAANFEETSALVCNASDLLYKQVEEKIENLSLASGYGAAPPHSASKVDNLMENSAQCTLSLKKKECKRKGGKRYPSWVEKISRGKKGAKIKHKTSLKTSRAEITNSFYEVYNIQ